MSENRLPDYLDHIQQAATDARSFVEGMASVVAPGMWHLASDSANFGYLRIYLWT